MKYAWLGCLVFGSLLFGGTQDSDINVNARYTVDAVTILGKGWKTSMEEHRTEESEHTQKLTARLKADLVGLIGQKLHPGVLDGLADRLRRELSAREVIHRLLRADTQDHVRVEFEVRPHRGSFDTTLTKFSYNSKQGWTGAGEAGLTVHDNSLVFGLVSDGDSLPERYAGFTTRYENHRVGTERVSFRFGFDSYHEQWNRNTILAVEANPRETSPIYRTRQNFQPTATIVVAKPLTLEIGFGFERFEEQLPTAPVEASNAMITNLRYHRRAEGSENQQDFDATYGLRAASRPLGSDFVYTSHSIGLHYRLSRGKQGISDDVYAGVIGGRAPLSDRFILGNSYFLRGWNKFDIDPIGGSRVAYNSVDYRYGPFQAFYDTGAIWDSGQPVIARHSLGVGIKESIFSLAVAFPVRGGHIEPVVMMGLLY